MNFAASLHKATHSSFIALCAITLAARTTLAITTNAITATFLIASPFSTWFVPHVHFIRSMLAAESRVTHFIEMLRLASSFLLTQAPAECAGETQTIHR